MNGEWLVFDILVVPCNKPIAILDNIDLLDIVNRNLINHGMSTTSVSEARMQNSVLVLIIQDWLLYRCGVCVHITPTILFPTDTVAYARIRRSIYPLLDKSIELDIVRKHGRKVYCKVIRITTTLHILLRSSNDYN